MLAVMPVKSGVRSYGGLPMKFAYNKMARKCFDDEKATELGELRRQYRITN